MQDTRPTASPPTPSEQGARLGKGRHRSPASAPRLAIAVIAALATVMLACAAPALAGPWWRLSSRAAPTHLAPGSTGLIDVSAQDLGNAGVTGASHEVIITDVLPHGLSVTEAGAINAHRARVGNRAEGEKAHWKCTVGELREVSCSTAWAIPAYELFELEIPVVVNEPSGTTTSLSNEVSVQGGEGTGGGAVPSASLSKPVAINAEPVSFGVEQGGYAIAPENADGSIDTLAGSHPYQLTSTLDFNQTIEEVQEPGQPPLREPAAPALAKNLSFDLPPGLLGNVTATERCSALDFSAVEIGNSCPAGSAVGVATVTVLEPSRAGYITLAVPLFNLEPAQGEPARFGFVAVAVPVVLDTALRSGSDYGVSVSVHNATEAAQVLGARITFWGDPGSESHDNARSWGCLREGIERNPGEGCAPPNPRSSVPLLTLPTFCGTALSTSMQGESWSGDRSQANTHSRTTSATSSNTSRAARRCRSSPSIEVQPEQQAEEGQPQEETSTASTPTGLNVDVKVAQQGTLTEGQPADADVQSARVTLPAGMQLNPSAANGLQACSESQIGYLGPGGSDPLAPGAEEPIRFSAEDAHCPSASKIGTVAIRTPLLSEELRGSLYLANPAPNGEAGRNPFGSLVALYIAVENPVLGLRVKLAGEGRLDEQTGQITTVFQDTPQVPFEELRLQLFGGPRGPVGTPALCGSYRTRTAFTAWSGAVSEPESEPPFSITSGPGHGPCLTSPQPFAPAFAAGSTNSQSGALSFSLTLQNPDGDQALQGLTVHLPPGVAAMLSTVTPCPEPQASRNECGPESLIGHSTASLGPGEDPVTLEGQVSDGSLRGGSIRDFGRHPCRCWPVRPRRRHRPLEDPGGSEHCGGDDLQRPIPHVRQRRPR